MGAIIGKCSQSLTSILVFTVYGSGGLLSWCIYSDWWMPSSENEFCTVHAVTTRACLEMTTSIWPHPLNVHMMKLITEGQPKSSQNPLTLLQ